MHVNTRSLFSLLVTMAWPASLIAAPSLPSIFGDHMVLQQNHSNPVWGWADPGESIGVSIAGQDHRTKADNEGAWRVALAPIPAGGPYTLTVRGKTEVSFSDVLVGEVWICSGQSNMAWTVTRSDDAELEIQSAKFPDIRIISVPQVGTQQPQTDFEGHWQRVTPESIAEFSAVGYSFGRRLHQTLEVPIGLIDNAWGGSAAEAWIRRDALQSDGRFDQLMAKWEEIETAYDPKADQAKYQAALQAWNQGGRQGPRPRNPRNPLTGNQRPANIFNGVLHPTIGYGIRGAIWYQGESNASRAHQYRDLFPLMIQHWRDLWQQGDFPFYYVQLADFREEKAEPGESDWAELREAQTMVMDKLEKVGQAVIIDIGEGRDIHPRNKQMVANRLARWALANDYGFDIHYRSPTYRSMKREGNKIILTFDHVGQGLYAFDTRDPRGFAIAAEDRHFTWAKAKILGENQVEVWNDEISHPVAIRYAWADNPVCNLFSRDGLPVTPFRTDDWPGVTVGKHYR